LFILIICVHPFPKRNFLYNLIIGFSKNISPIKIYLLAHIFAQKDGGLWRKKGEEKNSKD